MGAIGQFFNIIVNNQETLGNTIGWAARNKQTLSGKTWNDIWGDGFSKGLENLNHEADYFQKAKDAIKTTKDYTNKSIPQKIKTFFSRSERIESAYVTEAKATLGKNASKRAIREFALKSASKGIAEEGVEVAEKGVKGFFKKIPIVGAVLTLGCEVPSIIKAFQNGDGAKQVGRSSLNVLGFSAGTLAATAIGTAICPGIGTAAGFIVGAIGGMAGGAAADKLGTEVFGKSIEDQKQEAKEQQSLAANGNTISYLG